MTSIEISGWWTSQVSHTLSWVVHDEIWRSVVLNSWQFQWLRKNICKTEKAYILPENSHIPWNWMLRRWKFYLKCVFFFLSFQGCFFFFVTSSLSGGRENLSGANPRSIVTSKPVGLRVKGWQLFILPAQGMDRAYPRSNALTIPSPKVADQKWPSKKSCFFQYIWVFPKIVVTPNHPFK